MNRRICWTLLLTCALLPVAAGLDGQVSPSPGPASRTLNYEGSVVSVIRDPFGVPHVFASSTSGAYFGGGYATAEDRLFQLERFRRDARGELAEIEGPGAAPRDRQTRMTGYTEAELASGFKNMSDNARSVCTAYAAGINAYINEAIAQNRLPSAFIQAGIARPREWKVTDSVAILMMMAQRFGTGGGQELANMRILQSLHEKFGSEAAAIFDDLFWRNDPASPTTIPPQRIIGDSPRIHEHAKVQANEEHTAFLRRLEIPQDDVIEYAETHALPTKWGSYAWVLSPNRTVGGVPILLGGPQMGFTTPSIVHEIHYAAPGFQTIGIAFPGIPGILVGHNGHVAWTVTCGSSDVVDVFAETLDPARRSRYEYRGMMREMEHRIETVRVRGSSNEQVEVFRTVHGPIIAWDDARNVAFSRAVAFAGQELATLEAILSFSSASNLDEFEHSALRVSANLNFVAADSDGHVGYWHTGKIPIRSGRQDRRLPVPGTGEFEWQGFVPSNDLPHGIDPSTGYLANWNNKPTGNWDNGDRPSWGEVDHVHNITSLIDAKTLLSFEGAAQVAEEISTLDEIAAYLKPAFIEFVRSRPRDVDPRVERAIKYLEAWDNQGTEGSVAKTIFDEWYRATRAQLFDAQFGAIARDQTGPEAARVFESLFQPSFVLRVLKPGDSRLPLSHDYLKGRRREDIVYTALLKAILDLEQRSGPQMNSWGYSRNPIRFTGLPPMPGSNRGTYIHIVELSLPMFRHVSVLPPGQNENPASPHYGDQRELAGYWRFKPMLFSRKDLESSTVGPR